MPKMFYLWNYDNQDGKSGGKFWVFDHGDLKVCVLMQLGQRPITRNGNMAAKTEDT